jgi:hypothetical protein
MPAGVRAAAPGSDQQSPPDEHEKAADGTREWRNRWNLQGKQPAMHYKELLAIGDELQADDFGGEILAPR